MPLRILAYPHRAQLAECNDGGLDAVFDEPPARPQSILNPSNRNSRQNPRLMLIGFYVINTWEQILRKSCCRRGIQECSDSEGVYLPYAVFHHADSILELKAYRQESAKAPAAESMSSSDKLKFAPGATDIML